MSPVRVDPGRILQVLGNLLSNAIRHSPDGGTVTVRARAEGEVVVLEVRGTGMDISPLDQQEVFTKFFGTGTVRSAALPCMGMGLVQLTKHPGLQVPGPQSRLVVWCEQSLVNDVDSASRKTRMITRSSLDRDLSSTTKSTGPSVSFR